MKQEIKKQRNIAILQVVLWIPLLIINIIQGDWSGVILVMVIFLLLFRVYMADRFTIEYKHMVKDLMNDMEKLVVVAEREIKAAKKGKKRASTKQRSK